MKTVTIELENWYAALNPHCELSAQDQAAECFLVSRYEPALQVEHTGRPPAFCCLGFIAKTLAPEVDLSGPMPSALDMDLPGLCYPAQVGFNDTEFAQHAAEINDSTDYDNIYQKITELEQVAADEGFRLRFVRHGWIVIA